MTAARVALAWLIGLLLAGAVRAGELPPAPPAELPASAVLEAAELAALQPDADVLLERLVPLGTGPGNAADFLAALRPGAPGHEELEAARERAGEVDLDLDSGPALPAGDPLLLAAAGWTEQTRCAFFDGAVPFEGWDTWRPDEELVLLLARSWAAEARATGSPEPARRAARLGRLLLQEQAWPETSRAGLRALVLGVNELRRQATAAGRWPEAVSAFVVLRRAQERWLRERWNARMRARTQARRLDPGWSPGEGDLGHLEVTARQGGAGRLADVAWIWQAAGDERFGERTQKEAAAKLAVLKKHEDPAVAAAAAWCARTPWTAEAAGRVSPPPEALRRARRSPGDPAELWLLSEAPPCAEHEPPLAPTPPPRAEIEAAGPPPELARPEGASVRSVLDRLESWDRGEGIQWSVLPVDDPFLLAYERWLLAGASTLPELEGWWGGTERRRLEALAWRSLLGRLARLAGTAEADRAAAAALQLARRDASDIWFQGWRWSQLAEAIAWHELARDRPQAAVAAARDALAARLSWSWQQFELVIPIESVEARPLHRGFFGFGPARAPIEPGDLDVLRDIASERCETHVRQRAADGLHFVAHVGNWSQRRAARRLLADLAADSDAALAEHAEALLDAEFTKGKKDLDVELAGAVDEVEDTLGGWFGGD